MSSVANTPRMVIANRLRDGQTVFLAAGGQWVISIKRGLVVQADDEAARLLAVGEEAAARNVVIGPYLITVRLTDDGPVPLEWRESIRAFGPTVEGGHPG